MRRLPLFFGSLTLVLSCNGHGYVQSLAAGGKEFSGWLPFTDPYKYPVAVRIVRKVPGDAPITNTSSPSLVCNDGGKKGTSRTAEVVAGSNVTFKWTQWPDDHLGPVTTYMTSCGGDCTNFDPTGARWFKIDEAGYTDKEWATTKLISQNNTWTSTIPKQLRSGEYLLRNEIMALHDASAAQMYPSCSQVKVTGGGDIDPSDDEQMTIAEVYRNFTTPDIWDDSFTSFAIPGPRVAAVSHNSTVGDSSHSRRRSARSLSSSSVAFGASTGSYSRRRPRLSKHASSRLPRDQ